MTFKYCLISLDNFLRSATFFFYSFFFFSILMPHCTPWWDIKFLAIMDLIWNHLVDMVNCLSNCVIFGNFLNTFNKRKEEKWCIYRLIVANCLKLQFYNGSKLSVSSLVRHLVYTWMTYSPFKWVDKHSSEFLWKWPSIRAELKNCEKQPKEMTFKPGELLLKTTSCPQSLGPWKQNIRVWRVAPDFSTMIFASDFVLLQLWSFLNPPICLLTF